MSKKKTRKQKHVPQRMCVVCRQKVDKRQLTRVVRTAEKGVIIDPTGKQNGRGAYLCDQLVCWQKAINVPGVLNQALNTELNAAEIEMLAAYKKKNITSSSKT